MSKTDGRTAAVLAGVVAGKLKKKHGVNVLTTAAEATATEVQYIPTGVLELDCALGGGFPAGRVNVLYGHKSCLAGDSFVPYEVRMPDGRIANHKGGTIQRLWERFNGKPWSGNGNGKYLRPATIGAEFYALSVNDKNCFFYNRVTDVVAAGEKECFLLTTLSGLRITATADHRFFDGTAYVRLENISPGDTVFVHSKTYYAPENSAAETKKRAYLYVKHHPVAGACTVPSIWAGGVSTEYVYHRLMRTRAVMEAHLNGLALEAYLTRLNDGVLEGLTFLPRDQHVHHVDEDVTNDVLANLSVVSSVEHGKHHAAERHDTLLRYVATADTVSSIEPVGVRATFDLCMEAPHHNFVADGFVTHNSCKSTVLLKTIAQAQQLCATCFRRHDEGEEGVCKNYRESVVAYLDVEGTFDKKWAERHGVDNARLLFNRPEYAEQAIDVSDALLRSGDCDMICIDSIAFLSTAKEQEESAEKLHVGAQARLMSGGIKKFTAALNWLANEHQGRKPTIMLINQIRMKIGLMFGNPETQPGGLSHGFAASTETLFRPGKYAMDEATGRPMYADFHFKVDKNKTSVPKVEGDFRMALVDTETKKNGSVMDEEFIAKVSEKYGVLTRKGGGGTITFHGKSFKSMEAVQQALESDIALHKVASDTVRAILLAL